MEVQKHFFEILKTQIPDNYRLVDVVEETLKTSTDSAYRRIRGEKDLSFSELHTLCQKYNISLDEVFSYKSGQNIMFQYMPVNLSDQESYIAYIRRLLSTFTALKSAQRKDIYFTAQDIPFYHFMDFPELFFFKLYTWNEVLNRVPVSYNDFCSKLDKDTILPIHKQMSVVYQQIPSKEIWTNQTIDTILKLLEHYFEIGSFDGKETILLLLDQLSNLMDTIKNYANDGYKGKGVRTPFSLYLSSVDLENNRTLIKRGENMSCIVRLNNVNSISTENSIFCLEMFQWIEDLISKSILISGTAAKERSIFFKTSQNKIDVLINKIKSS